MDATKLTETVKLAEALRLRPYDDDTGETITRGSTVHGVPTIGWGHSLDNGISPAIADWLLHDDLVEASAIEQAWPHFTTLNDVRQRAFTELAFNLGVQGLLGFRRCLHSAEIGDWATAKEELLDSVAAQEEPARFHRLSIMIESGEDV